MTPFVTTCLNILIVNVTLIVLLGTIGWIVGLFSEITQGLEVEEKESK